MCNKTSYHSHWRNENSLKEILKKKVKISFYVFTTVSEKRGTGGDMIWNGRGRKRKEKRGMKRKEDELESGEEDWAE